MSAIVGPSSRTRTNTSSTSVSRSGLPKTLRLLMTGTALVVDNPEHVGRRTMQRGDLDRLQDPFHGWEGQGKLLIVNCEYHELVLQGHISIS